MVQKVTSILRSIGKIWQNATTSRNTFPFGIAGNSFARWFSGSDGSDSGRSQSATASQTRDRTDTGDTANTDTERSVRSVDSTALTMKDFHELLRNNVRLMVAL